MTRRVGSPGHARVPCPCPVHRQAAPPNSGTSGYSPPLSNTPQTTTVLALTSGAFHLSTPAAARSCADLLSTTPVTFTSTQSLVLEITSVRHRAGAGVGCAQVMSPWRA